MQAKAIALLIDSDNCPAGSLKSILDELSKYGDITIRRAYGDWKNQSLNGWAGILHDHAIQPVQQFAYTKGKNATDSAMIIDAMDLLYTQKLVGVAIASSDSDFTPLAMRIRTNGIQVFGFGEKKTPQPFINACSKFLFLESLADEQTETSDAAPLRKRTTKELRGDTKLTNCLRNAVTATSDEEGWSPLSAIGSHIVKNDPAFDPRNYGYRKLSELVIATELFEMRKVDMHYFLKVKKGKAPLSPASKENPQT